ncbi:MAG: hypothetical protein CMH57_10945 [Myxococcales bacterium]|nr:hypothetical protein [Myxococcales bacterium]
MLVGFALGGLTSCADEPPVEDDLLHDGHDHGLEGFVEDELPEGLVDKAATCSNRWQLPSSTAQTGRAQNVPYQSAGSRCTSGATQGALALRNYLRDQFGDKINRSIPGDGVQIYNCRQINGGSGLSLHSVGRALDIFIPTWGSNADNGKGDVIANWLVENAEYIGIQMLIWDRTIWTANRSTQARCYTGSHPHNDHIHVELTVAASSRQTAFFRDLAGGSVEPPTSNVAGWIGSGCDSDNDCGYTDGGARGWCYQRGQGKGVCTLDCAGYCPDRNGYATTFCAQAEEFGDTREDGLCLSRATEANSYCGAHPDLQRLSVNRFLGNSSARPSRVDVCAPKVISSEPDPEPQQPEPQQPAPQEPDPEPEQPADNINNSVCRDPSLPASEHGDSCAGWPENHWRCACFAAFGTSVSQVCRGGRWINYELNVRDCSRCDGDYSRSCEGG